MGSRPTKREDSNMKRIISGLLVFIMCCGFLSGCREKEPAKVEVEGGKLKVGVPQRTSVTDYNDNAFTKYLEENTGVEIEFVFFSSTASEYKQQLALMASSKEELPDVLTGLYSLDANTVYAYGQDGYFMELTELIEKHGDAYKKAYDNQDKKTQKLITQRITDPDTGNIYALPYVGMVSIDSIQSQMYINQTWLDAVGMKAPTNIDELYNVLKAFQTKDPNGNGQADEIPMLGGDAMINYVLNAFLYYEQAHPYNVKNGEVYAPFITNEYKQALQYMNKLCKEGLYSDMSFTVTSATELKNLYTPTNGVAQVGIICGHPQSYTNAFSEVLDQYTPLDALGAATNEGGYTVIADQEVYLSTFITKDCENPELAMKFCDFFYEEETIIRQRRGEKDVDWKVQPGKDFSGEEVPVYVINSQAFFEGNKTWGQMCSGILTRQNFSTNMETDDQGEARLLRLFAEYQVYMNNARIKEDTVRNLTYTSQEFEIKEQYESTLNNYVREQIKLFVMGTEDINSEWNNYVQQVEELGLKAVLGMKQTAYDRANK